MAERTVTISGTITVGSLAESLGIPATSLISELFKNGIAATINEKLDFDTAEIITSEILPDVKLQLESKDNLPDLKQNKKLDDKDAVSRPPVVAVMGHVDHGKTTLLDAIRKANTVSKEAGGITQHISAYQVSRQRRLITFLDTPGHEAFASLREHGAHLTDIAIIVIAADDGIKPQTKEAIRFASQAGVKMLVAITKIDKEGANPERIKQQLSEENMLVEEWGGDTIVVPVSAKTGQGIDQLLDMILLVTDVEELKSTEKGFAEGLVIESHVEQGRGPVVTMLVQQGTIKKSDAVAAGDAFGKIRTLSDTNGKEISKATPSTPVVITGFKSLPEFGEIARVYSSEKDARLAAQSGEAGLTQSNNVMTSNELIRMINKKRSQVEVNVIIKADVQGSLTSVVDSLKSLENEEVALRVVGSGVGNINESDEHLAATSDAIIYGFNVQLPTAIKRIAARDGVKVQLFKVIYELLDAFKKEASARLLPELVETEIGQIEVAGIFRTDKSEIICGGKVISGKVEPQLKARIKRGDKVIGVAVVSGLKRGPQESKEVFEGEMCGIQLSTENKLVVEIGDKIELFKEELVARSL